MNIQRIDTFFLEDSCKRYFIDVNQSELVYFGYFLESFEGWCNYTTINKNKSLIQVDVSPDYINEFEELIQFLMDWNL